MSELLERIRADSERHNAPLATVAAAPAAPPVGVSGSTTEQLERLDSEGRLHLVPHKSSAPPFVGSADEAEVQHEADSMGLSGAIRSLFVKERKEGWIAAGQLENDPEGGGLVEVLSDGILHGGSTSYEQNPSTGTLTTTPHASATESAEHDASKVAKAVGSVAGWAESLGSLLSKLLEPGFWLRVLKFALGAVLIIVALLLFSRAAGSAGGETASGVAGSQKVGAALADPAGAALLATAGKQRRRQSTVSPGRRAAVEAGRSREAKREPERDKRGRELSGPALQARERRRVRERGELLR